VEKLVAAKPRPCDGALRLVRAQALGERAEERPLGHCVRRFCVRRFCVRRFGRRCAFDLVTDPGAIVPPVSLEAVYVLHQQPDGSTRSAQLVACARAFEPHSPVLENVYLLSRQHAAA
jgi:hypothetical protein